MSRSRGLAAIAPLVFAAITAIALACGSQTSDSCTATANGSACTNDSNCCSGYCKVYADVPGAFCQDKVTNPPKEVAGTFCTQNSHCESGLCNGNVCFGTPPQPGSCDEVGSQCIASSACCTGICKADANGRQSCVYPDAPFDGGAPNCLPTSASCAFPSDCCSGFCVVGKCASKSGGGTSCGKAGATCRGGIDCCSGQCTKLGSGSTQCR